MSGCAIVGDGEASLKCMRRVANWAGLDPRALSTKVLVLAGLPPAAELRQLLQAAASGAMTLLLCDGDAPRPLRLEDLIAPLRLAPDWAQIGELIQSRRVLITGGGGSIGGELARRVASLAPRRLTILDSSEHNLFQVSLQNIDARLALADIRDGASMRRWMAREKPDLVFHAAALKQVPLVEAFASEGALTNLCGLRNVVEAVGLSGGADLIFVSTDKAVAPSGFMGASKRMGELYCQALDRKGPRRAIPVRLGNVLGSSGSVAPTFERLLAEGRSLTVTDPKVSRYFISIPQAADALLHAAAVGLASNQRGASLAIDMGEPLPVVELARAMIALKGLRPEAEAPIVFSGLRPGEKLHEQLVGDDERRQSDPAPGVLAASSPPRGLAELNEIFDRIALLAVQGADKAIAAEVSACIAQNPELAERLEAAG